ncbi:hypothetical protein ACVW00_001202 [Marmoricola sp. URHA0025 HA25]
MDSLGTGFDALLTRGAVGALVLAACWALVVVAAVALEARTEGRLRLAERTGCPPRLRLWLLGAFVALSAGVAPAEASDAGSGPARSAGLAAALDGLPLPDRTAGTPGRAAVLVVQVEPGDSLWRIARALLPAGASDPAVTAEVADLYADNRPAIGPDPDLLMPGQRLLVRDHHTTEEAP